MNASSGQLPAPAEAGERPLGGHLLDRDDRVGDAQAQVVVGVDADRRPVVQHVPVRADAVADVGHGEPAAGVGDVDAGGAGRFHDAGVLRQHVRLGHVTHHQETGDVEAEFAGGADVLDGDVGLGAVGGDAHRGDTEIGRRTQISDRADAGQQERGHLGRGDHVGHRGDPLGVAVRAGSVGQAASGEAVPVGDLDGGDPRGVQRRGDGPACPVERPCETACIPSRRVTSWT